jgi:hypothetical protein
MPVSISRCEKSTSRILDASQSAMPADAKSMAREYGIHIRAWKHDIFFTLEFNDEIWITWITRLSRRFFRSCSSRPTSQRWLYFPCIYRVFWINLFPFVSAVYIYIYIYIYMHFHVHSSYPCCVLEIFKQKSEKRFQNAIRKGLFNRYSIVTSLPIAINSSRLT